MNKATLVIICFWLYTESVFSANLEEIKVNDCYFYAASDAVSKIKITYDSFDLDVAQLSIKVLPVDDYAVYLTFPDGGNMVICLEEEINPEKLTLIIDNILTEKKKKLGLMGVIGWKPRIDWFATAVPLKGGSATLEKMVMKLKIGEVLTPPGVYYSVPGAKERSVSISEEIDLLQVVSPIKMSVDVVSTDSGKSLAFRISYLNFNFFFTPIMDLASSRAYAQSYNSAENRIIFSAGTVEEDFIKLFQPIFFLPWMAKSTLITDGHILYISEKIPFYIGQSTALQAGRQTEEIFPEKTEKKVQTASEEKRHLLMKGHTLFEEGKYRKAIFYFNKVLNIDVNHSESLEYIRIAKIKMYFSNGYKDFTQEKYKESIEWFKKVLELEPSHGESMEYIKRAEDRIQEK
ncbi:MAG: hypothetical protein COS68_00705 [Elusimicrobia bacterium CG06_land_8_20_14_3_00_38_11]|nr:MAG: hypothetical protein COS68_00705 [Elusimicrobia bacterium CG06_land_8_20_14_3_00_38_11]